MLLSIIKDYIMEKNNLNSSYFFDDLRLRGIEVDTRKKTANYLFSFPSELPKSRIEELSEALNECALKDFKSQISMTIDKLDVDVFKRLLMSFIKDSCLFLHLELQKEKTEPQVTSQNGCVQITFCVSKSTKEILLGGTIDKITNYFGNYSCHKVNIIILDSENDIQKPDSAEVLDKLREVAFEAQMSQPVRKIFIEEKRELIGKLRDGLPKYIIDIKTDEKSVVVCGTISNIQKFKAKTTETTICKFNLKDFTGSIPVVFFAKDEKALGAFSTLYNNDEIIVIGNAHINSYDNMLEIMAGSIGRCKIAATQDKLEDFKPCPSEYYAISPEPFTATIQSDLFGKECVSSEVFEGKSFVVFDFETTGIEQKINTIIEIGAVKILDGRVVETFFTLINPQRKIPAKIIELTGITDEMVKDKPLFQEVVGDFYKFCFGSTMVAHNADFDYGFLSYYAKPCGYLFNNKMIDTIAMAKQYFAKNENKKSKPENFKLETLVKKFGLIWDRPHRADSDALTEAFLFLKLLELDKSLLY